MCIRDSLCIDNFFTGTKRNVQHLVRESRFELVRHDVTVPLFVEVDHIFNLCLLYTSTSARNASRSRPCVFCSVDRLEPVFCGTFWSEARWEAFRASGFAASGAAWRLVDRGLHAPSGKTMPSARRCV